MDMVVMPGLDAKFLKTLVSMWDDPAKRKILEDEGTTEDVIADARERLAKLGCK